MPRKAASSLVHGFGAQEYFTVRKIDRNGPLGIQGNWFQVSVVSLTARKISVFLLLNLKQKSHIAIN